MAENLKHDVGRVFSTNLIKVFSMLIASFLIPIYLSIEEYSVYKYYMLIVSYIGILHFGFCDGLFLEYGGRIITKEDKDLTNSQVSIFFFETLLTLPPLIYGIFTSEIIMVLVGLNILPTIMFSYYTLIYQATGDFKHYAAVYNCSSLLNLFFNAALLFIIKLDSGVAYSIVIVAVNYIATIYAAVVFRSHYTSALGSFKVSILYKYMKMGILLTIGNVAFVLFGSIDKWFIIGVYGNIEFAYYAFAVQLLSLLNMVVGPIGFTLYSYMCKRKDKIFEYKVKIYLVLILTFLLLVSFLVQETILLFLPKYRSAIPIISVLFLSQVFVLINTTLYINLFKTYKRQNEYFVNLAIAIAISFILDFVAVYVSQGTIYIAYATLASMVIWTLLNSIRYKELKLSNRHLIFLISTSIIYLLLQSFDSPIYSFVIYIAIWLILWVSLAYQQYIELKNYIKTKLHIFNN